MQCLKYILSLSLPNDKSELGSGWVVTNTGLSDTSSSQYCSNPHLASRQVVAYCFDKSSGMSHHDFTVSLSPDHFYLMCIILVLYKRRQIYSGVWRGIGEGGDIGT